jgi:hypothetical protein
MVINAVIRSLEIFKTTGIRFGRSLYPIIELYRRVPLDRDQPSQLGISPILVVEAKFATDCGTGGAMLLHMYRFVAAGSLVFVGFIL